ncbi:Cupin domain-containing protein [Bosea sp. CRIB-10]|uniref:cupin domain-containing protein n=1 Tax=Bosea sp. CRIB-10 TaxID=378404 RepID=UPI0008E4F699|nr:cupin domain-containing protein [Bosea sp. CRIB-10]SFD51782.1 Cupin domain-containing protein [Bosea sp. CRIB-10]
MITTKIFDAQCHAMQTISGPLLELASQAGGADFAVIRSIAPPGIVVPLHSHAERETMVIIDGMFSAWLDGAWADYGPGEIIDVPPNVPHALRNNAEEEVALVLVSTRRMAQFFTEVSVPPADAAMTPARLAHFSDVVAAYGF